MTASHSLFVYGTLRLGKEPTVRLPGEMYDCGWFPGVRLGGKGCNSSFIAECIQVSAERLAAIDKYEGYIEFSPKSSLYLRKPISAVIGGKTVQGWIYTYNRDFDNLPFIESGDWLQYTQEPKGMRSDLADTPKPKITKAPEPVFDGERAAK